MSALTCLPTLAAECWFYGQANATEEWKCPADVKSIYELKDLILDVMDIMAVRIVEYATPLNIKSNKKKIISVNLNYWILYRVLCEYWEDLAMNNITRGE